MKSADKDTRSKPEAARDVAWDIKKAMVAVMKKERRTVKNEEEGREEQQERRKRNQVLIRPRKGAGGVFDEDGLDLGGMD